MHIWYLSQCLIDLGHKVIVVTHAYGKRQGIRYMTNGLKVYYLPLAVPYDQVILPTFCAFFPLFRNILIRENITLVHGHQSTSTLSNECIFYARAMNYPVIYTDHSLFSLNDFSSLLINKLLQVTLSDVDHIITVSKACKSNLLLRARVNQSRVPVTIIPNAVDGVKFTPDPSKRYPTDTINIILLSRLVYRKGIQLLVQLIPLICDKYRRVHFIVGGDGPLRSLLDRMCEKHDLHHRVELLGTVAHCDVRDVLVRGHLFLNCSFTESFCMALLEAASCGLFVVSTEVGGIPEVLPPSMVFLARPIVSDLENALDRAIAKIDAQLISSPRGTFSQPNLDAVDEMHGIVCAMYSWPEVARQTEAVYDKVLRNKRNNSLFTRMVRYRTAGPVRGVLVCFLVAGLHLLRIVCESVWPERRIERCPTMPWGSGTTSRRTSDARIRDNHIVHEQNSGN